MKSSHGTVQTDHQHFDTNTICYVTACFDQFSLNTADSIIQIQAPHVILAHTLVRGAGRSYSLN